MTEEAPALIRRIRRRRRRLLVLVLILVVLLARVGLDLWAVHRVDQEVARLERLYGGLAEGSRRLPPVPAADNRARVVRAAAALIILDIGSPEQRALARFLTPRTSPPVPAEVRAFVEANRAAIRLAEDGKALRESNWDADYALDRRVPPLMDLRTLSNAIYLSALIDLEEGRADAVGRGNHDGPRGRLDAAPRTTPHCSTSQDHARGRPGPGASAVDRPGGAVEVRPGRCGTVAGREPRAGPDGRRTRQPGSSTSMHS